MCGIAGFLDVSSALPEAELEHTAGQMATTLHHRGPDGTGVWSEPSSGLGLGQTRLAIIDLSPAGQQPMHSACGRYCIIYNGEIYNAPQLRKELEGVSFRGHSDTEVLLEAIAHWGLEAAVRRSIGMFAFALWDRHEKRLTLVRDRLGIKPLYYGWMGRTFLFGSELKALRAHPHFHDEIDRSALGLLLQHNYIPAPYSIYRGVSKLPPGATLQVSAGDRQQPTPVPYWNLREVAELGRQNPFRGSSEDAVGELDAVLRDAVRLRLESDVPLGAFLSGGIDSSTVVALMQAQTSQPVKTFCIGFEEREYNEAGYAASIAHHLQTDHTECYVTAQQARDVIPRLPAMYDEPFSDSSQIPTFLVSQLARNDVTVSLSGDGGDELFGGYNRYFHFSGLWQKVQSMPGPLRKVSTTMLRAAARVTSRSRIAPKLGWRAEFLSVSDPQNLYAQFNTHWKDPQQVAIGSKPLPTIASDSGRWADLDGFFQHMMYVDAMSYLPDDILAKVDRASMAVSLEARVPLLDHRVVEFAWSLPLGMNIQQGRGKLMLRRVLDRYVPRHLVERPKVGFGVPIDAWLRGPLREWGEELLDESRLKREGFFQPRPIREKWEQHLSGREDWHYYLWDILMFQAWLAEQRG